MRNALIDARGTVVNVILLDEGSNWQPPTGYTVVPSDVADIGDTWDGTNIVRKPFTLTVGTVPSLDGVAFLARVTDDEYAAITGSTNVQVRRWIDMLRLTGTIDVNSAPAQSAKVGLVALGLLTQPRADVIFAS